MSLTPRVVRIQSQRKAPSHRLSRSWSGAFSADGARRRVYPRSGPLSSWTSRGSLPAGSPTRRSSRGLLARAALHSASDFAWRRKLSAGKSPVKGMTRFAQTVRNRCPTGALAPAAAQPPGSDPHSALRRRHSSRLSSSRSQSAPAHSQPTRAWHARPS